RPVVGQSRSPPVDRSRPLRRPSAGRSPPRLRHRPPLLLGGLVRAPSGQGVRRDPPGPAPEPATASRSPDGAPRVGVPGSTVHLDAMGPVTPGPMRPRRPARPEAAGALAQPPQLRAAAAGFDEP